MAEVIATPEIPALDSTPDTPAPDATPDHDTATDPDTTSQALTTTNNETSVTAAPTTENTILSSTTQPDGTVVQHLQTPTGKKIKKIIRKKRRPARVQVDPSTITTAPPPQTGTIFNIWYNKWSGGDRDDATARNTPAATRCNLARDTGYTRADAVPGSFFCMFFARGCCPKGADCEFLHRRPDGLYDAPAGQTDVFGRDKHADYRDDMGGVGSFLRQNRTLYVGRIVPSDDIEEIVNRHFTEWGSIERIRVLAGRGVAFVTYATEALAQFAKEAMSHQALDNEEVINVRWATVDPNPVSQKREARAIERQAADAIRRVLPPDVVAEIQGDEGAKRRRLEDASYGLEGYRAPDEVWMKHEREKQLRAPEEPKLIEAGAAEVDANDTASSNVDPQQGGGIFGASTLAALKNRNSSSVPQQLETRTASSGPLVGYDGDEDDDEW